VTPKTAEKSVKLTYVYFCQLKKCEHTCETYFSCQFDMEGVAEKVRIALDLNGIEYEDSRFKRDEWAKLKPTMPSTLTYFS